MTGQQLAAGAQTDLTTNDPVPRGAVTPDEETAEASQCHRPHPEHESGDIVGDRSPDQLHDVYADSHDDEPADLVSDRRRDHGSRSLADRTCGSVNPDERA